MNWREQFHLDKIKNMKKTDWLILVLLGVLLMIIALPSGSSDESSNATDGSQPQTGTTQNLDGEDSQETYAAELEEELKAILDQMDGVGETEVMITLKDDGEKVVEKDTSTVTNTSSDEEDGITDKTIEQQKQETTVYSNSDDQETPFVSKEIHPEVEGVLVVAAGGASAQVRQNITDAVLALFSIEAHKIVVVKMNE